MTFSFFLSIYSRCGVPASWAARHTTVCLDMYYIICIFTDKIKSACLFLLPVVKKKDRFKKSQSQPLAGFGEYKYKKK